MFIEKKSINRTTKRNHSTEEIKNQEMLKSNIIVGEKYILKDINEIETRFLLRVGLGISYSVVLAFLVFKLLA
jgi:hypothetical protein